MKPTTMKQTKKNQVAVRKLSKAQQSKIARQPRVSRIFKFTTREDLVAKLNELYTEKKVKLVAIAEAGQVRGPSAYCWLKGISLPTEDRCPALVQLVNSVK